MPAPEACIVAGPVTGDDATPSCYYVRLPHNSLHYRHTAGFTLRALRQQDLLPVRVSPRYKRSVPLRMRGNYSETSAGYLLLDPTISPSHGGVHAGRPFCSGGQQAVTLRAQDRTHSGLQP